MSLRWRILRALVLTIGLTAVLSLGIGYTVTRRQFDAFVSELGRQEAHDLAGRLSRAYTDADGWETLDIALAEAGVLYKKEAEHRERDEGSHDEEEGEGFHLDRIRVVIVDADGRIIRDNFSKLAAGTIAPDLSGERIKVLDLQTDEVVAHVFVDVHQDFLATESFGFLRDLLGSSALSGAVVIVIALLLATSLSKRITAPITALTRATQSVAQLDDAALLPINSADELGQMSRAFNSMILALQRQRDMRKQLINDVSHELNTPLTVIQLEAKGLLDKLQSPTRAAQLIIQEVSMLRNLVNDLNSLAETEPGKLQLDLEPCVIGDLLTSEVDRWQPQAQASRVSLSLDPLPHLPTLQLDSLRIRQALGNIIQNALKHTEQGQVIVAATVDGVGAVRISVWDGGAGIASEDLPYVFQRFYRADHSGNRGTGLGLNIARAIIEAHSGSINAHSEGIGLGTIVQLRLPPSAGVNLAEDGA